MLSHSASDPVVLRAQQSMETHVRKPGHLGGTDVFCVIKAYIMIKGDYLEKHPNFIAFGSMAS